MTKKKKHSLRLQFDGEQASQALLHLFECDGKPAITTKGRYAGSVQFNKGDEIDVYVTMTTRMKGQKPAQRFSVISLDLVSVPDVTETEPDISPFRDDRAVKSLIEHPTKKNGKSWPNPQQSGEPNGDFARYQSVWAGEPLTVTAKKGFWKLSGYLSVNIEDHDSGCITPRVFRFDPEVITGGRE